MSEQVCQVVGCEARATRYPKVLLRAEGKEWGQCEPLILVLPLPMCLDCQPRFDPDQFLGPESQRRLRIALMERGKAMPNFDDPCVTWAHVGDKDWREYHAAKAAA